MEKKPAPAPMPHSLILEERSRLTLSGVRRVLHCGAESAAIETAKGTLRLAGTQLSVTSLDLEAGEARLSGRITALEYIEPRTPGGFLRRLLH